ncbi:MAG TPA: GtrA family protein [Anaerolineales bacterium]|nr:GtrA family protein [Anaerolineales bacterium]
MTRTRKRRRERTRFFRFAVVGAIGSAIDIGVMNLLTQVFHFPLVIGGSISFVCAVVNNFLGNRYWTYPDSRSRRIRYQFGMFFLVNAVGIAIRIPILKYVEPPLAMFFESMSNLSLDTADALAKNATLLLAIGVVMLWNFFANRYWTYNDVD